MVAAVDLVEIGDHCMAANGCMITDGNHRFDDPDQPVTWQGFNSQGPDAARRQRLARRERRRHQRRDDRRPLRDRRQQRRDDRPARRDDRRRRAREGAARDRVPRAPELSRPAGRWPQRLAAGARYLSVTTMQREHDERRRTPANDDAARATAHGDQPRRCGPRGAPRRRGSCPTSAEREAERHADRDDQALERRAGRSGDATRTASGITMPLPRPGVRRATSERGGRGSRRRARSRETTISSGPARAGAERSAEAVGERRRSIAAAGSVRPQAVTMLPAMPQRTADTLFAAPAPITRAGDHVRGRQRVAERGRAEQHRRAGALRREALRRVHLDDPRAHRPDDPPAAGVGAERDRASPS